MVINKRKKLALILIAALVVSCIATAGITWVLKDAAKKQRYYEQRAIVVGIAKAKSECLKSGFSADICGTLSGSASTVSDATSETVWIVYVISNDSKTYKASMVVKSTSHDVDNLIATGYRTDNLLQR